MRTDILEGSVVIRREENGRCVIEQAPQRSCMSLELLAACDPVLVKVHGREIRLAGQVTYRVVGWDDLQAALTLERVG